MRDLPEPLLREKVQIKKDTPCPICKGRLLSDEGKPIKNMLNAKGLGLVHDSCFLPYMKEEEIRILFQIRCYSIGDTIAATPALRELRRMYPRTHITVLTFFPELFEYNPCVSAILDMNKTIMQKDIDAHHFIIDGFNQEIGQHFAMHSVDYSSASAFGRSIFPIFWDYDIFYRPEHRNSAIKIARSFGIDPENDKLIVLHPHRTEWKTRDWGPSHMEIVSRKIFKKYPAHKQASIGGKRDVKGHEMKNYVKLDQVIDLYGTMSLLETAAFLDLPCCKLMITPDTGALHLAGSRKELPLVGIFTLVRAHFRTPIRYGKYSYKFIGVDSDTGCCCTYDNRQLTNEMHFDKCPKLTFLEETQRLSIPKGAKIQGLQNLFPEEEWSADSIGKQIREKTKEFNYENLPCFPTVEKVMTAVDTALEKWGPDASRE